MLLALLLGRAHSVQYHPLTSLVTVIAERFASLKNEDGKVKKSALTLPSGAGCDNIILLSDSYKVSPRTTPQLLPVSAEAPARPPTHSFESMQYNHANVSTPHSCR